MEGSSGGRSGGGLRPGIRRRRLSTRKHTDEGALVTTGLTLSPDGREAVLTVTDDGPGLAPDFLPKIFSRFARADAARSGSAGTIGLGLAIVKAIVEHHGGEISGTSTQGEDEGGASGTRFEVRLPTGPR